MNAHNRIVQNQNKRLETPICSEMMKLQTPITSFGFGGPGAMPRWGSSV